MSQDRRRYLSYLIRIWQVKGEQGWQWRASLESPASGKLRAFPNLDHLIAYLRAQLEQQELAEKSDELDE